MLHFRRDLKLVLMSATLNAELFQSYFGGESVPLLHIPGRAFPVESFYLEDALALTHYTPPLKTEFVGRSFKDHSIAPPVSGPSAGPYARRKPIPPKLIPEDERPDEDLSVEGIQKRYPSLDKRGANALLTMKPDAIQYPLIEALVEWMVFQLVGNVSDVPGAANSSHRDGGSYRFRGAKAARGRNFSNFGNSISSENIDNVSAAPVTIQQNRGILIFLPGYEEISNLRESLYKNPLIRNATQSGRYLLPVHGSLSSEQQAKVFQRPPDNQPIVKIVIATNIAETSITIDDMVYVIDSGRMKETRWDPDKGMASLEEWYGRTFSWLIHFIVV